MEDVYGFLGGVGGGPLCALSGCDGTVISSCPAGFSHSYSLVPEESEALSGSLPLAPGGTPGFRPLAGSGGGGAIIAGFCSATGVRSSGPPRLTIDSLLLATDGERELWAIVWRRVQVRLSQRTSGPTGFYWGNPISTD